MKRCVSTSLADPCEFDKKCTNSLSDFLPAPSATFAGIEQDARLICEVNPNRSSDGKAFVTS